MGRSRRPARNRYRSRNKHQQRNRNKLTFAPVVIMLCISVGCGYAAAKYVVDPVVNYVPQLAEKQNEKNIPVSGTKTVTGEETDVIEDEVDIIDEGKIAGYALQFGCYSEKESAETVLPTISVEKLQVVKQNDLYKIVGEVYKTKNEAKKALEVLPETVNAFVTPIYE